MKPDRLRNRWDRLNRERIRSLQAAKLRRFLRDVVLPYSKHYGQRFAELGIRPDDFRTLDDLAQLPFSSKDDLVKANERPGGIRDFVIAPDPEALAKKPSTILRALLHGKDAAKRALRYEFRPVFMTSTTGRSTQPIPFVYTQRDVDQLCSAGERLVAVLGATEEDKIINAFPFAPHLAFWQTHYATITAGVFTLSTGGGKVMGTSGNIRLMGQIKPTVLIGMPTFLYHMLSQALEEGLRVDSIRTMVLGGEKVPAGMRKKLASLAVQLGSREPSIQATYGFTEARLAFGECPHPLGSEAPGYHLYPDLGLFEVVDPETGKVQPDGAPGELVYTPLDVRGSVVIRYRTNDVVDGGLTYEPCPACGRSTPRIVGNIARRSEIRELKVDKVKGVLVDFNQLEHVLDDCADIGAWQIELRKINDDPMELGEVLLHVNKIRDNVDDETLARRLSDRLLAATELCPNRVQFHTAQMLRKLQGVGVELKEQRVVDHRAVAGEPPPPPRVNGARVIQGRSDHAAKR